MRNDSVQERKSERSALTDVLNGFNLDISRCNPFEHASRAFDIQFFCEKFSPRLIISYGILENVDQESCLASLVLSFSAYRAEPAQDVPMSPSEKVGRIDSVSNNLLHIISRELPELLGYQQGADGTGKD